MGSQVSTLKTSPTPSTTISTMNPSGLQTARAPLRQPRMNFYDLANLLDNDGNLQNEMMVASFAATMLATIPVLLGNEFDVNVGLKKRRKREEEGGEGAAIGGKYEEEEIRLGGKGFLPSLSRQSTKFLPSSNPL